MFESPSQHLSAATLPSAAFRLQSPSPLSSSPSSSPAAMVPQGQSSSLQRLHQVEKRIVRVMELAGAAMVELGNSQGPVINAVAGYYYHEFMLSMKEIQATLREEIKSACEYHPFEKCDDRGKIANEICCKKLKYVNEKMDAMQLKIEQSTNEV